jgi:hypothetical protein
MTGYTLEEIRAYHRVIDLPKRRYYRASFENIARLLTQAFAELNNALVEAVKRSNYDGKWN